MILPGLPRREKNRLRAVFLLCATVFLLSGCYVSNFNPTIRTIAALIPGGPDVSGRAAAVSYASLDITVGPRGGLVVLAEKSGGLTLWQSSSSETIALRDGYLVSSSGYPRALAFTQWQQADSSSTAAPWRQAAQQPISYTLTRTWQTADGTEDTGRAQVRLVCQPGTKSIELPLTTLALQRCDETMRWNRGVTTSSVLWRNPDNHRIWAVNTVPWPDAPRINWKVARPWW